MQGLVPVAGEGTRMRPVTKTRPKGLVEIAGKPLLTHVFETLTALDVTELVVIVGYRGEQIREYYGGAFEGTPITYARQESRDGLADALLCARPHIDGEFLLMNGDNVIHANTGAVLDRHSESDAAVTALVEDDPENAGKGAVFELDGEGITGIIEKPDTPPSSLVPRGFYALSPLIFPACELVTPNETGEYELTDAIDLLIKAGHPVETVTLDGWCHNVNTPAQKEMVEQKIQQGE